MENTPQPPGLVANGAYRWNARLGDWDFDPASGVEALEIYHRTTGGFFAASALSFSRMGDDLFINVPELTHRLRLKGWYADETWNIEHLKYRTADTFEDVIYGAYEWKNFSEVVPPDLRDLAGLGLAPLPSAESVPGESGEASLHEEDTTRPSKLPAPEGVAGGAGKELLGTAKGEELSIGLGVDKVIARGGDDVIRVQHLSGRSDGSDDKTARGGHGIDTVDYRGAFNDSLAGIDASLAKQTVKWGAGGSDRLASMENIGGTDAADRFEGSKKNNVMTGYRGDDWYKVRLGGGHDTIVDEDDTAGNLDTLVFGKGIRLEQLSQRRVGDDVVIDIHLAGGELDGHVTIRNGHRDDFAIEKFVLASGVSFNLSDVPVSSAPVLGP